jgi:D-glycero-D-manno-heptose 1,7-bisphosphate phosphatase
MLQWRQNSGKPVKIGMLRKAVFLDKDGTLIVDVPYNVDPALIVLSDNCLTGLAQLQQDGYLLVLVTNQPGVALGYFNEEQLAGVAGKLNDLLAAAGVNLDGFYYCPHMPVITNISPVIICDCRKPSPGLLLKAAGELGIDLNASWMIGDILNDIEAGKRAGCKSILINNGNETEWLVNNFRIPHAQVKNINEAANHILKTNVEQLAIL